MNNENNDKLMASLYGVDDVNKLTQQQKDQLAKQVEIDMEAYKNNPEDKNNKLYQFNQIISKERKPQQEEKQTLDTVPEENKAHKKESLGMKMVDIVNAFGDGMAKSIANMGIGAVNLAHHYLPIVKNIKMDDLQDFRVAPLGYERGELEKEHPVSNFLGEIAPYAFTPGSIGALEKLPAAVSKGIPMMAKGIARGNFGKELPEVLNMIRNTTQNAGMGGKALSGALSQGALGAGYGTLGAAATNPDHLSRSAILGSLLGVATGGIGGAISGGFSKAAKNWRNPEEADKFLNMIGKSGQDLPLPFGKVVKSPKLSSFLDVLEKIPFSGINSKMDVVRRATTDHAGSIVNWLKSRIEQFGGKEGNENDIITNEIKNIYNTNKDAISKEYKDIMKIADQEQEKVPAIFEPSSFLKEAEGTFDKLGIHIDENNIATGKIGSHRRPISVDLNSSSGVDELVRLINSFGGLKMTVPKQLLKSYAEILRDTGTKVIGKERVPASNFKFEDLQNAKQEIEDARATALKQDKKNLARKLKISADAIEKDIHENLQKIPNQDLYKRFVTAQKNWKEKIKDFEEESVISSILHSTEKPANLDKSNLLKTLSDRKYRRFLDGIEPAKREVMGYNLLKKGVETDVLEKELKDHKKLLGKYNGLDDYQRQMFFTKHAQNEFEKLKALDEVTQELPKYNDRFEMAKSTAKKLGIGGAFVYSGMHNPLLTGVGSVGAIAGSKGLGALLTSKWLRDFYRTGKISSQNLERFNRLRKYLKGALWNANIPKPKEENQ
jgi:hypothetical protein